MSFVVSAVVVIVAASVVYSRAQAQKMAKKAARDREKYAGTTITAKEPAASRRVIYGRRRTGGVYALQHSTDTPGGKTNEWLHLVIPLAGHEVHAIDDIYFDDVVVPLGADGVANAGKYSGLVRVKKFLGAPDQAASADLITEAPTVWTNAHRLRGVAYLYVRLKYDQDKLAAIPNISAVVRGKKLYDPRTGLTTYSENPALAIRDYLTNADYGLGCAADEIDEASFIAAASLCEEPVNLAGGGTEPRYAIGGTFERDQAPEKIISELAASMAGACVCTGGLWYLTGGKYIAPSATFTLADLRGQIVIQSKASRRDTCNAVKGTYISEKNKFQPSDYPPVKNATYAAQDGETIWRELDLPWTNSSATAQRLAKIELEQARQEITVQLPCKLTALRVKAGDTVALTIARYGWVAKEFTVTNWRLVLEEGAGEGGGRLVGVDLSLRETAAGVWDWNSGMETTVDFAPNTNLPDPSVVPAPTALTVTSSAQINPDGSTGGRLDVSWVPTTDAFAQTSGGQVQAQYKLAAAADWTSLASLSGEASRVIIPGLVAGQAYLVRIRAVRPNGAASAWVVTGASIVAAGDVTAPGAPTGLVANAMVQGIRLSWTNPTAADLARIDILEQSAATPAPDGATLPSFQLTGDAFIRAGLAIGTTRFYWIRAVDRSGNASAWVGPVSATALAVDVTWINGLLQDAQIAAIAAAKVTGQIVSTQITDGAISTPKIAAGAVTAATIAAGAIVADKIAAGAVVADKIAANAITADKVGANQIITASANIANAVVTTAKIANLAVDTLRLADQAVTIANNTFAASDFSVSSTVEQYLTVLSGGIVSTGAPVFVLFGYSGDYTSDVTNPTKCRIRLRRGATILWDSGFKDSLSAPSFLASFQDTPGAGSHTYVLEAFYSAGIYGALGNRMIHLMETKK